MPPKRGTLAYDNWKKSASYELFIKHNSESHKGQEAWNKGKICPQMSKPRSRETCDLISKLKTGLKRPDVSIRNRTKENRDKVSRGQIGEKNHAFGKPSWNKGLRCPSPSYETRLKLTECLVGGFWYGNPSIGRSRNKYCYKWIRLRNSGRIGAAWGFKSVLSGETDDLCYHHVYYQPKACCKFDEECGIYYVVINVGTNRNKQMHTYYINGDPNKFVPLTRAENSMVNSNKLYWIKVFEDLIEKNGGISYIKEETV